MCARETPTVMNLLLKKSVITNLERKITNECAYLANAPRTQTTQLDASQRPPPRTNRVLVVIRIN